MGCDWPGLSGMIGCSSWLVPLVDFGAGECKVRDNPRVIRGTRGPQHVAQHLAPPYYMVTFVTPSLQPQLILTCFWKTYKIL